MLSFIHRIWKYLGKYFVFYKLRVRYSLYIIYIFRRGLVKWLSRMKWTISHIIKDKNKATGEYLLIQLTLVISTSLISKNRLCRSKNLGLNMEI